MVPCRSAAGRVVFPEGSGPRWIHLLLLEWVPGVQRAAVAMEPLPSMVDLRTATCFCCPLSEVLAEGAPDLQGIWAAEEELGGEPC